MCEFEICFFGKGILTLYAYVTISRTMRKEKKIAFTLETISAKKNWFGICHLRAYCLRINDMSGCGIETCLTQCSDSAVLCAGID